MIKSYSNQRMQLYSQSGGRRSSLEDFQPNTTTNDKFAKFSTTKYKKQKDTLLPLSELVGIKERSLINHYPEALRRQKDREELRDKSNKRVQNWPNTLQAIRKKRDQWRFEKFEKEEIERRKIDEEEKKYQEKVKKQILDKANKQIYLDQDRIRSFQSKMLLSDALQEREAQVEQLKALKEIEKFRNQIYDEEMREIVRQQEQEEQRKHAELQEKKRQTAKILQEQHAEMRENFIKKLQEEKIEGEIMKLQNIEACKKEVIREQNKILRQKELNKEVAEGNKLLERAKQMERQKELQEEKKIQEYAAKKEKVEEMKRIRSEQRFKEKQSELAKLQKAQFDRLEALKKDEEARVNKQIIEAEIKAENIERQKREYREKLVQKIDASMKFAIQKKKEQNARNIDEDERFKQYWVQKNKDIQKREEQEQKETNQRNKDLQSYHLKQIESKQKQREEEFIKEIEDQRNNTRLQENQDQHFDVWTKRVLENWQEDGKNIYPLLAELQSDVKKRPGYQRPTQD